MDFHWICILIFIGWILGQLHSWLTIRVDYRRYKEKFQALRLKYQDLQTMAETKQQSIDALVQEYVTVVKLLMKYGILEALPPINKKPS